MASSTALPASTCLRFLRVAISIILGERSIATIVPVVSRSQTRETATPWPQPTSSRRSAGRTSKVSTAQTNRSDALPAMRPAIASRAGRPMLISSADSLCQPDEKSFGSPDVAEPIRVLVLDQLADELRAALAEPVEQLVDVVYGEHDPQVAEGVHGGVAVIGDHRRLEKVRKLQPTVAVRRAHHGYLDALVAKSGHATRPLAFDHASAFELEAELAEEGNRRG